MTGQIVPFKKRQTRYDWQAAWLFYCSDPTITLPDVQARYHMSYDTLRKKAARDRWTERRSELMEQVGQNAQLKVERSLVQRHERTILVAEKLRDVILAADAEVTVKDAVSALPAYAKLEQLFGGGATENLRAMPMIDPDNLTVEEMEELARLLEKGRGEAA